MPAKPFPTYEKPTNPSPLFSVFFRRSLYKAWSRWFQFPELLTQLVIWGEFIAPLLLIIGLFTRYAAAIIGAIMIGAIAVVHAPWGFFMNWYMESQRSEGFEYHLLVLSMVLSILLLGGVRWSLDWLIKQKRTRKGSPSPEKLVHA